MANRVRLPLRVIVADDSLAVRDRLSALISHIPDTAVIATARDGREALEQTRELQPDVLVLDQRMPRMSGLAVLKTIREEKRRVIVIALTTQPESIYRDRLLAAGADYFLSKETQMNELEQIVEEVIFRHQKQG